MALVGEYEGSTLNTQRDGSGTFYFANKFFKYEGEYKDGLRHGQGRLTLGDGSFVEGQFVHGELYGEGRRVWADGSEFQGEFVKGVPHGKGSLVKRSAATGAVTSVYDGDFHDGRYEGRGFLRVPEVSSGVSTEYEGDFHGHKRHGAGVLEVYEPAAAPSASSVENGSSSGSSSSSPSGRPTRRLVERYEGQWVQGQRHGTGHSVLPLQHVQYTGEWHHDVRHGEGVLECDSTDAATASSSGSGGGLRYSGTFVEGNPQHLPVRATVAVDVWPLPAATTWPPAPRPSTASAAEDSSKAKAAAKPPAKGKGPAEEPPPSAPTLPLQRPDAVIVAPGGSLPAITITVLTADAAARAAAEEAAAAERAAAEAARREAEEAAKKAAEEAAAAAAAANKGKKAPAKAEPAAAEAAVAAAPAAAAAPVRIDRVQSDAASWEPVLTAESGRRFALRLIPRETAVTALCAAVLAAREQLAAEEAEAAAQTAVSAAAYAAATAAAAEAAKAAAADPKAKGKAPAPAKVPEPTVFPGPTPERVAALLNAAVAQATGALQQSPQPAADAVDAAVETAAPLVYGSEVSVVDVRTVDGVATVTGLSLPSHTRCGQYSLLIADVTQPTAYSLAGGAGAHVRMLTVPVDCVPAEALATVAEPAASGAAVEGGATSST